MKNFIKGAGVLAFVVIAIWGFTRASMVRPYTPPSTDVYYFASLDGEQDVFVSVLADGTIATMRSLPYESTPVVSQVTYKVRGIYANQIIGPVYVKGYSLLLNPHYADKITPLFAELECSDVLEIGCAPSVKKGDTYHDTLYFSDDVFYLGDEKLTKVDEMPLSMQRARDDLYFSIYKP